MENNEINRIKKKYQLLSAWMKLKIEGIELADFFHDRDIGSIAIYGMGEIGQLLYDELAKENPAMVKYAVDQSEQSFRKNLPTFQLEKGLPKVDAIVITPVLITDQIEEEIYDSYGDVVTYVFEEILYELSRKYKVRSDLWEIM